MTTGSVTPTTDGQERRFEERIKEIISLARQNVFLDKEAMQRLLSSKDFQRIALLESGLVAAISKCSAKESKQFHGGNYFLQDSFKITVPRKCDYSIQLAQFRQKMVKKNPVIDTAINDEKYSQITDELIPGKKYLVRIFGVTEIVSAEECIRFLVKEKSLFVGPQGASLFYQMKGKEFPANEFVYVFANKLIFNNENEQYFGHPYIQAIRKKGVKKDDLRLRHAPVGRNLYGRDCFLCVNEL